MLRFLKTNVEKVVWDQFAGPAATCRMRGQGKVIQGYSLTLAPLAYSQEPVLSRLSDEFPGWSHRVCDQ